MSEQPEAAREAVIPAAANASPSYNDLLAMRVQLRQRLQDLELWLRINPKPVFGTMRKPLFDQLMGEHVRKNRERAEVQAKLATVRVELDKREPERQNAEPVDWEYRKAPRLMTPAELRCTLDAQRRVVGQLNQIRKREQAYLHLLEREVDRVGLVSFVNNDGVEEIALRGPAFMPEETP